MPRTPTLLAGSSRWPLLTALLLSLGACASDDPEVAAEASFTTAKAFDRELVLSDEALTDADAMTVDEVQAFLERTPNKNRSALADYASNGRTAAEAFVDAGRAHGINPLVLMTRTQLEQSLISKTTASKGSLDWAMGCGCPDNKNCIEAFRGFDRQIDCAAERLRSYLTGLADHGETVAGWSIGRQRQTLDGYHIAPRNAATAAIYTYTPWVSSAKNHSSIWRKYALTVGYIAPAPGGCDVVTFPSKLRVQTRPAPSLGAMYDRKAPSCFIDSWQLIDPYEHTVFDVGAAASQNFRISEFTNKSSDSRLLLSPVLVDVLQSARSKLGRGIAVNVAYRSPDAHAERCGGAAECEATEELTRGTAAVVSTSAGDSALIDVLSAAGAPTCFAHPAGVYVAIGLAEQGCPR